MRVATVTLRKGNKKRKVNMSDYSRNIAKWAGWERVGERRGDHNPEEEKMAVQQAKIEEARQRDPEREKKFGDKERAQKARNLGNITTGKSEEKAEEPILETEEPSTIDPEWGKMPWIKRRQYVKEVTGKMPKSAAEAVEFMTEKGA